MKIIYATISEKGIRYNNDDSFNIVDMQANNRWMGGGDGMGGHSFGDSASKIVVDDMSSHWKKHVKNENEVMMGLDLIEVPQMHELLTLIYVMRMTDEEVMKKMNMSEQLFKKTRKVAETMLKECLISEGQILVERKGAKIVNLVSEALSDLSGRIKTISSDDAMLAADKMFSGDDEFEEIKEALEQFYPGLPWMEQWTNFVLDRAAELNWNEEDETVFYERFCHHADPVSLAKRLGRARTWVDNKFCRQNKALVVYIKKWWSVYCR